MSRPAIGAPARRTAAAHHGGGQPPSCPRCPVRRGVRPRPRRSTANGARRPDRPRSRRRCVPRGRVSCPAWRPSCHPMMLGRPGATSCTSTEKPSRRSHASTTRATACSLAPASPGRWTLGIRTSWAVRSTTSCSGDLPLRTRSMGRRDISNGPAAAGRMERRAIPGEGQDDRVEAEDPELLAVHVEVVPLDFLGRFLEGDDRLDRGHVAERVGAPRRSRRPGPRPRRSESASPSGSRCARLPGPPRGASRGMLMP